MGRFLLLSIILLQTTISVSAQTDLTGREYYCDLTVESDFNKIIKSVDDLVEKAQGIRSKKEAKGLKAIYSSTISYVSVKFINAKTLKYQWTFRINEERARNGGATNEMIRMIRTICQNNSSTIKANYTINGNTIIAQSKKMKKTGETLTFELNDNDESLTYVTKFKRTKLPRKK